MCYSKCLSNFTNHCTSLLYLQNNSINILVELCTHVRFKKQKFISNFSRFRAPVLAFSRFWLLFKYSYRPFRRFLAAWTYFNSETIEYSVERWIRERYPWYILSRRIRFSSRVKGVEVLWENVFPKLFHGV